MTAQEVTEGLRGPAFAATPWTYHQGHVVAYDSVGFTVATQGLNYGTGVFEGIRAYWDPRAHSLHVVKLREHLERFAASARLLHLDLGATVAELSDASTELLVRNGYRGDTYLRPIAHTLQFLPGTAFGVRLRGISTATSIYALPMPAGIGIEGVRCLVSSWRRVPDESLPARAKITGSYANLALAVDEATSAGCDDAILLNTKGTVAEASTANVFLARDGQLITPHLGADILAGITRGCVIELAATEGDTVVEREVPRSELYSADEIFLTGTGCELVPVIAIDGRSVGDGSVGPVTRRYLQRYRDAVHGRDDSLAGWLTTVRLTD
ncbi:MAG TPA: branched-chain amino acid transaminase [Actinophytocola sp.]|jgi:branched-chain amino acid aminotransferase|uniref:branched-chain amino acid transaminase n=1 Tax=Actinophytocola sp. TaxID=1872138 RepID=UPI002E0BB6FA|nr:branched-chain amino acid transaminase [Actinophytocola sp.]